MHKMFKSDNNSGAHEKIIKALCQANEGHDYPYGYDAYTVQLNRRLKEIFGPNCESFPVLNGTGANVIGLSSMLSSYEGVICSDLAHIHVDECGAFEKFTGSKLLQVPSKEGKIHLDTLAEHMAGLGDEHRVQPKVISISQMTEMGTCYTPAEIKEIADFAHEHGMYLHLDGARLANAAVALGVSFPAMTFDAGLDILSFGGTKNGMIFGEVILTCHEALAQKLLFLRKQGMHLVSKMRYISAQFLAYLEGDLWHENAAHANQMGQRLKEGLMELEGVSMMEGLLGNMLFLTIPKAWHQALYEVSPFYVIDEKTHQIRLVTSFDTTQAEVDAFILAAKKLAQEA